MSKLLAIFIGAIVMGIIVLVAFILMAKQQEFVNSLKPGDPISFHGCQGKFVGYSRGKLLIELEVPEMMISEPKNENSRLSSSLYLTNLSSSRTGV